MSLTPQQAEAVKWEGNLSLTACPGSGKTKTLTAKLVQEVGPLRDTPRSIACITYTNTAVQEIELRAATFIEPGDERHFEVSTIHAFCLKNILRPFSWRLPDFTRVPKVLTRDKPEFEEIATYALDKIGYPDPKVGDFDAFEGLNLSKDGDIIGSALENDIVKRAAPHFWKRCDELGYIDFCNIIYRSYCLMRDHDDIPMSLAARYAYFLIDEFQDTTELQVELLRRVHATARSQFFIVGDPAQSIYGFTGARPELLPAFAKDIGARTDLSLSGNFRSNPGIVAHGERLYPRNSAMTAVGENRTCTLLPAFSTGDTFTVITEDFLPALAAAGISLGEATILAREWAPLIGLSRRLRDYGIPVYGPGARPYRKSRLFATLAEQLCGAVLDPEPETTRRLERALFNAIHDVTAYPRFDVFSFDGRVTIVRLLREAKRLAEALGGIAWLDTMSNFTGQLLFEDGWIDGAQCGLFYASVQDMKSDMQRQNLDLANFSVEDLGLFASPTKALKLSTIHFAKGREYDAVAIIGAREGTIPNYRAKTAEAIDAEKRLFYVGVTRARRLLMYVYEPDRFCNPPSQFLGPSGVKMF